MNNAFCVGSRWRARSAALAVGLALVLLAAAVPQGDAKTKAAGPSIKLTGISVDQFNAAPNTKITYVPNNPPNACYDIGGAAQDPTQVTVVFFIHAVGIPANAPTTVHFVTPWNTLNIPSAAGSTEEFSKTWFRNKGHGVAAIFGGSDAPDNFYKYDDEGTAGNVFNGFYSVTTTVKVHGKLLHAHGTLHIDC
jgi:hypothetical protein